MSWSCDQELIFIDGVCARSYIMNNPSFRMVLMDEDQDISYNVTMTKVDVKYGSHGMNNFYIMQVRI